MNSVTVTAISTVTDTSTGPPGGINGIIGAVEGIASDGLTGTILKLVLGVGLAVVVGIVIKKITDWYNAQAGKQTQLLQQQDQATLAKQTQTIAKGADDAASQIDEIANQSKPKS